MKQIQQALTKQSLFLELQRWCRAGAGRKRDALQIMSAFASGSAVEALEPFFDVFLSDGNSIDIIIGIDRNGTSRDAIWRLYELQNAYIKQVTCRVFQAPSYVGIFHPKLYLHRTADRISAVTGSANLTLGGLGNNFESLFLYDDISHKTSEAKELVALWDTFAGSKHPLKKTFLRTLTKNYAQKLMRTLPKSSNMEGSNTRAGVRAMWKPISMVSLPRSNTRVQKPSRIPKHGIVAFLIIDVLMETRETQMQLPLADVEQFFGMERDEEATIKLSQVRAGEITQPIERRIVISSGKNKSRLMRRIEMPQIAGKDRPLVAIFLRLARQQFTVEILPRNTPAYRVVDRLLSRHGQQPLHAVRRYYVGMKSDNLLRSLRPILGSSGLQAGR